MNRQEGHPIHQFRMCRLHKQKTDNVYYVKLFHATEPTYNPDPRCCRHSPLSGHSLNLINLATIKFVNLGRSIVSLGLGLKAAGNEHWP